MVKASIAIIVAALVWLGLVAAPAAAQQSGCRRGDTGKIAGTVIGAGLGAILGRKIDGGRNRGLGTVLGGAAGALVGNRIGASLDRCEQEKVNDATLAAVNDPQPGKEQTWRSDTRPGVGGKISAGAPEKLADGRECRPVRRVSYVNGEEIRENPTLCRVPPQTNWSMG